MLRGEEASATRLLSAQGQPVRGEGRETQQERAARRDHKKEVERDEKNGGHRRRRLTPKQCCVRAQEEGDTAATGRRLVA